MRWQLEGYICVLLDYSVKQGNLASETRRFYAESHPLRQIENGSPFQPDTLKDNVKN